MHKVLTNLWLFRDEQQRCFRFVPTGEVSLTQLMCAMYKYKDEVLYNEVFVGNVNITTLFWKVRDNAEIYENDNKNIVVVPWGEDTYLIVDVEEYMDIPTYPTLRMTITKEGLTDKGFKKCTK